MKIDELTNIIKKSSESNKNVFDEEKTILLTKNKELTEKINQLNEQIYEQIKIDKYDTKDKTSEEEINKLLIENNKLQIVINELTERIQEFDNIDKPNNSMIDE